MKSAILLLLVATRLAATSDATAITATELPLRAAGASVGPSFTTGPDGAIWLSWVERGAAGAPNALQLSRFNPGLRQWGAARTVVANGTVTTNPADFPQVAIDGHGGMDALWTDGHGGANLSTSHDRGATWSAPQPWVRDGHDVEKFSLVRLADGRVLAAWLDGRRRRAGGATQQLYTRVVGEPEGSDQLVDPSVCDCCPPSLAPFLDGGARLAYRGRSAEDVRDIFTARFRRNRWDQPQLLNGDDWHLDACPVNGPRLFSDGSRVAVAWFTAAAREPRVNVSFSPDAGERWLMPLRVDHGHPTGHVDAVLLRDTTILVTWLEADGSLWLRRISPDFSVNGELELAPSHVATRSGMPRLAVLRDYAGGQGDAEVLVAFTRGADPGGVHTLLVTVPEGQLLTSERNCDCLPTPAQLTGFSIRGTIVAITANAVHVQHADVPGVFSAGEHVFAVAPGMLRAADAGRPFLGRIDRRGDAWTLYDVRFLGAPGS